MKQIAIGHWEMEHSPAPAEAPTVQTRQNLRTKKWEIHIAYLAADGQGFSFQLDLPDRT